MSTVKLKLLEARELQKELFGFRDEKGEVVLKGILSQDLRAITKFKLVKLGKKIQETDQAVEEQRKELVEKYGTEVKNPNGETYKEVVQFKKDKKGNPTAELTEEFEKFAKEFTELLNAPIEYEIDKLTESDLDFKTDEIYPYIFEYLVD